MTEPTLFDAPPATESAPRTTTVREHSRVVTPRVRRSDGATARGAAATVARNASALEREILALFAAAWMNDDELCRVLHERHAPTVKTARSRLSKAGRLVDTGLTRPSARGVKMTVWRLGE